MNTININAVDLRLAMPSLLKVGTGSRLAVLNHVHVRVNSASEVELRATDLDMYVTFTAGIARDCPPGGFLIETKALDRLAKSADKASRLSFEYDKDHIAIQSMVGGLEVRQTIERPLSTDELPKYPDYDEPVVLIPVDAQRHIISAFEFCSSDLTRRAICGVWMCSNTGQVMGTDGSHMYVAQPKESARMADLGKTGDLFFNSIAQHILRRMVDDGQWAVSMSGLGRGVTHIRSKQWDLWCHHTAEDIKMPNYRTVLPTQHDGNAKVRFAHDSVKAITQVIQSLPEHEHSVKHKKDAEAFKLTVEKGRLTASVAGSSAPIPVSKAQCKDTMATTLNRAYFLRCIKHGAISMAFDDELSPVDFRGDGTQFVVMPMRMV